jgi:spectinomycin phosphotransferase
MRDEPDGITAAGLTGFLRERWGIPVTGVRYAPVGFGDYHWTADGPDGQRWFVTVADLTADRDRPGGPDGVLADLTATMGAAAGLAGSGLEFVVAPLATTDGNLVARLAPRYCVTLFPYLDAACRGWAMEWPATDRGTVTAVLARLHRATPPAGLPERGLGVPRRAFLQAVADGTAPDWDAGPYAGPARELAARHAGTLTAAIQRFDRLAAELAATGPRPVMTHGEPHQGNVMFASGGLLLIDWDTAGLTPPERDLWLVLTAGSAEAEQYQAATGHRPDPAGLELYRLRWALDDAGSFLHGFRRPHRASADTAKAWEALTITFDGLVG